ncbi:MAG TPA: serine hydrolase domain-containing protein, partial [Gemmatimonadaceae bacterium]|nr:serine hydrolase domain-containing protein [Gemmatimonadaceae bacterium]
MDHSKLMTMSGLSRSLARAAQLCAACVGLSAPAHAQLAASAAARIDSVFRQYTAQTPGCAVLIRQNGATLYSHNYGLASLEFGSPISSRTVFNLASMSKQFTAASIVLLAQDGRLSLDDDVRKYVPELPEIGGKVTVRQLLTHTSGWRDIVQLLVWQGHQVRDHVTALDAVNLLRRQRALNFPPGTQFRYSNTGYFLMSLVVQRITGDSLSEFARKRIFEPLGMHDTRYVSDTRTIIKDAATGYEPASSGGYRDAMSGWDLVGAGGVYTTIEDVVKWDESFSSGTIGGRALTDAMTTAGALRDGVTVPYGLGLFVDQYWGQRRVWHNGIWAGYRSIIMRFPDVRLSIIALCNTADAVSELLADAVARIVLPAPSVVAAAPATAQSTRADATQLAGMFYSGSSNSRMTI